MKVQVFTISLLVVMAVALSGCQVVFTNPPAGKPKEDKVLRGRWISEEKGKEAMTVQFEKGQRGEVNVSFLPAKPGDKNPVFTAKLFEMGTHSYMVLNPTDAVDRDKGFLIVRYEISGDELSVWIPNSDKVTALIKQKRISGDGGQSGATVTESADAVSRFLESKDGQESFEVFGKFRKAGS
jgi:hypothetical protein